VVAEYEMTLHLSLLGISVSAPIYFSNKGQARERRAELSEWKEVNLIRFN
jgi:hypothetical protein